jgi:gamma-glutamylcyclotransferase (GGCT)/AIG2-like uncharacterized protein YtfP
MNPSSNRTPALLNEFFDILNQDIGSITFETITTAGLKYLRYLFHEEGTELSAYKPKYNLFSDIALEVSDTKLKKVKKHLQEIQKHLLKTLDDLVGKHQALTQKGDRTVVVEDDRFIQRFESGTVPLDKFDIKAEKAKAETVFLNLVLNENLIPSRFKQCKRCQNYFYQETPRERNYCSNNCSSSDWQKHRKSS